MRGRRRPESENGRQAPRGLEDGGRKPSLKGVFHGVLLLVFRARNWILLVAILGLCAGVVFSGFVGEETQMLVFGGVAVFLCVALMVSAWRSSE